MAMASPPTFRAKSVSTGVVVTTRTLSPGAALAAVGLLAVPDAPSLPHPAATRASAARTATTPPRMRLGTIPRIIPGVVSGCDHVSVAGHDITDATAPWPLHGMLPPVPAPASVTLVQGRSFVICDRRGDIDGVGPGGLFVGDRRVLSRLVVLVDGTPVQHLAYASDVPFHARFVGRVGEEASVLVLRDLWVGRGLRADVNLRHVGAQERRGGGSGVGGAAPPALFSAEGGGAGGPPLPAPGLGQRPR